MFILDQQKKAKYKDRKKERWREQAKEREGDNQSELSLALSVGRKRWEKDTVNLI